MNIDLCAPCACARGSARAVRGSCLQPQSARARGIAWPRACHQAVTLGWHALSPQVSDFGMSMHAPANGAGAWGGADMGTPAYAAPEAMDGRLGRESDVWSFGCLLFHMLTGSPPHADLSTFQVRASACTRAHAPVCICAYTRVFV